MLICSKAAFIKRPLGAVLGQDYPADLLELLVADGISDGGTWGAVSYDGSPRSS